MLRSGVKDHRAGAGGVKGKRAREKGKGKQKEENEK
jgi:hypothetical protein